MGDFYLEQPEPPQQPRTWFDYLTQVIIPVLALIATIVAGASQKTDKELFWGLVVVLVLALLVGPVRAQLRSLWTAKKNRDVAREYLPKIQKSLERFSVFVSRQRQDTLHYIILHQVGNGIPNRVAGVGMADQDIWFGGCDLFLRRLKRIKPSFAELQDAASEFQFLVGSYVNLCALPVYGRMPRELLEQLTSDMRRDLANFQQRFAAFLTDAEALLKDINESRPALSGLAYNFGAVKPLP